MARCPQCGAEIAPGAPGCTVCGAVQPLPPLPFSPFAPPPAEAAAAALTPREPLPRTQIIAAVGVGVLFLCFVIFVVGHNLTAPHNNVVPVLGHGSDTVVTGSTLWRVAYAAPPTGTPRRPPVHGQYYLVGVLVGNRGEMPFTVGAHSLALADADTGTRYHPVLTVWGTPEELRAGQYRADYAVPPRGVVAGVVLFDIPRSTANRQLLVRDAADTGDFTGAITLSRDVR